MYQARHHELWGWEMLFGEVSTFLTDSSNRLGNCSEEYAEYAIKKRGVFIQNITAVKDYLESSDGTVNLPQRREVTREMVREMNTLPGVLRSLGQE